MKFKVLSSFIGPNGPLADDEVVEMSERDAAPYVQQGRLEAVPLKAAKAMTAASAGTASSASPTHGDPDAATR
jgi:hypothetical protein